VIGAPFLVLGLLLLLAAVFGGRVQAQDRGWVGAFLLSPIHPATWRAVAAIVLGFLIGVGAFSILVSLFSTGASLLVIGVGIVIIGLSIEGARLVARVERWRARLADPRPLRPHPYRPYGSGPGDLLLAVFADLSRWRDVVYVLVAFPLTVLEFVAVVVLWSTALALLSAPAWILLPSSRLGPGVVGPLAVGPFPADPAVAALVAGLLGLALLPVAAASSRGLMALHRAVVAGLLCESEERALQRRVVTLEESRRAVLDVEASELRRIERDLHDGAQQRLVGLTIDLSLAAERIDDDPVAARGLVLQARDQARQALAEIRDLVRGIAPAILLDRGLVPAISALAARAPVPTAVVSTVPAGIRLPDAIERAAYFVVAESLANVAKHASATRCEVRVLAEERGLVVETWDDGAGGAVAAPGGGLAGLAGRVEALDGALEVESPPGGPTTVRAVIPVPVGGARVEAAGPTARAAPAPDRPDVPAPRSAPGAPDQPDGSDGPSQPGEARVPSA
jgi:signal transduction histidine kinase